MSPKLLLGAGTNGWTKSENGARVSVATLVGLGYDIRVGQNVSLTPYWNGFAMSSSNNDANVGQLGLGVTAH